MYDTFLWNWSKIGICDDIIFITSCICETIGDKISQFIGKEWFPLISISLNSWVLLTSLIQLSSRSTNFGTNDAYYGSMNVKKMYCMNNIVVLDHHGL